MTNISTGDTAMRTRVSAYRWSLSAFTLVGFALRAHRIAAQSLWSDEDITLDRAGQALGELLASLPVEHGPLYFAFMRIWTQSAGDGDLPLRLPSLFFGVLAIPLVGYIGSRLAGRAVGLIAALLMAVNPFLVWYGQEARMYTLVAALSLLALAAVARAEQSGWRGWWVVAGAATALCVYAHYYGALVVFVLVVWALVDVVRGGRPALPGWVLCGMTALVLFAPWLPRAVQVTSFPGWREPVPLSRVPWINLSTWSAGMTATPNVAQWVTWLYIALALIGLVVLIRQLMHQDRRVGAARLLLYALAPLVVLTAVLVRNPDFHPRYYFAVIPAFYLLVAQGAAARPGVFSWGAAFLLVIGAWGPLWNLFNDPSYQKTDYRQVIQIVEKAAGENDTTLWLDGPPFGMMERYRADESPVKIVNLQSTAMRALTKEELEAEMARRAGPYRHIWLAEDGAATGDARRWLEANAVSVDQQSVQHVSLARYYYPSESGMILGGIAAMLCDEDTGTAIDKVDRSVVITEGPTP